MRSHGPSRGKTSPDEREARPHPEVLGDLLPRRGSRRDTGPVGTPERAPLTPADHGEQLVVVLVPRGDHKDGAAAATTPRHDGEQHQPRRPADHPGRHQRRPRPLPTAVPDGVPQNDQQRRGGDDEHAHVRSIAVRAPDGRSMPLLCADRVGSCPRGAPCRARLHALTNVCRDWNGAPAATAQWSPADRPGSIMPDTPELSLLRLRSRR
jgi:hypothetical protein